MQIGKVRPIRIDEEMKGAYLDYAMSVITARALPDVRDGLKPVQRRILYAMEELSLHPTTPYKKSARIVGEVLGKYHPHGDAPVYESMVRMAQHFSLRYVLVDGQGNFGSVDGDPPAAMRYTEARLSPIAQEMLADIAKDTVDFVPNFDDSLKEPSVLPARLPNLLVNGSSGIAVGMATNMPPHNLGEVVDALQFVLQPLEACLAAGVPSDMVWARVFNLPVAPEEARGGLDGLKADFSARVRAQAATLARRPSRDDLAQALLQVVDEAVEILPEELLARIKGPDFPTAGIIQGMEGIRSAYATGHGRVALRARAHSEEMRGGRAQVVITELPFQLNKAALLEKIAELVRERRVEGISELRDESDRQGMRIVIELRRDVSPRQILNQLYKYTPMQTTYSINMLALVDGQPRVLTLKMLLLHYINYRRQVLTRRTRHDLEQARQRAHILQGLKIALDRLDEVIATIRRSRDADTARAALIRQFKLSELQAQAILDMQLRRLAALERHKILEELEATLKLIAHLEDLLAHPQKILGLIGDELRQLKEKYGDPRRTHILAEEAVEFTQEDLIPDQEVAVLVTAKAYVRRVAADGYLARRGSRGQTAVVEEDAPRLLVLANTHDSLLLFSDRGRAFAVKVHELPDASRLARGLPVSNFLSLEQGERLVAGFPVPRDEAQGFCTLFTRLGEAKRVALEEYSALRASGLATFDLASKDEVVAACLTSGQDELILVTGQGQGLRFSEGDVRKSGRTSGGVRAVRLAAGDRVTAAGVAASQAELLLVTQRGFAKRCPMSEFPVQSRGGGGVKGMGVAARTGPVLSAGLVRAGDEMLVASTGGQLLRQEAARVPLMGRPARGEELSLSRHGQDGKEEKHPWLGPNDSVAALLVLRRGAEEAATPSAVVEAAPRGKRARAGKASSAGAREKASAPGASSARGKRPAAKQVKEMQSAPSGQGQRVASAGSSTAAGSAEAGRPSRSKAKAGPAASQPTPAAPGPRDQATKAGSPPARSSPSGAGSRGRGRTARQGTPRQVGLPGLDAEGTRTRQRTSPAAKRTPSDRKER